MKLECNGSVFDVRRTVNDNGNTTASEVKPNPILHLGNIAVSSRIKLIGFTEDLPKAEKFLRDKFQSLVTKATIKLKASVSSG